MAVALFHSSVYAWRKSVLKSLIYYPTCKTDIFHVVINDPLMVYRRISPHWYTSVESLSNYPSRFARIDGDEVYKADTQFMWGSALLITPATSAVRIPVIANTLYKRTCASFYGTYWTSRITKNVRL